MSCLSLNVFSDHILRIENENEELVILFSWHHRVFDTLLYFRHSLFTNVRRRCTVTNFKRLKVGTNSFPPEVNHNI